jgi:hypothetical protein
VKDSNAIEQATNTIFRLMYRACWACSVLAVDHHDVEQTTDQLKVKAASSIHAALEVFLKLVVLQHPATFLLAAGDSSLETAEKALSSLPEHFTAAMLGEPAVQTKYKVLRHAAGLILGCSFLIPDASLQASPEMLAEKMSRIKFLRSLHDRLQLWRNKDMHSGSHVSESTEIVRTLVRFGACEILRLLLCEPCPLGNLISRPKQLKAAFGVCVTHPDGKDLGFLAVPDWKPPVQPQPQPQQAVPLQSQPDPQPDPQPDLWSCEPGFLQMLDARAELCMSDPKTALLFALLQSTTADALSDLGDPVSAKADFFELRVVFQKGTFSIWRQRGAPNSEPTYHNISPSDARGSWNLLAATGTDAGPVVPAPIPLEFEWSKFMKTECYRSRGQQLLADAASRKRADMLKQAEADANAALAAEEKAEQAKTAQALAQRDPLQQPRAAQDDDDDDDDIDVGQLFPE